MLTIKVLGFGCANCKKLESITHQVVDQMGVQAYAWRSLPIRQPILGTPAVRKPA